MPSLVSATSFICGVDVSYYPAIWAGGCAQSYLDENHGGDLLGRELLLLAEVLDLNEGAAVLVDDLEWP